MVIAAGGDEGGLIAVALHLLEAEHVTVERERAVDVGHLQVDVADVHARIDRHLPPTLPVPAQRRPETRGSSPSRDRRSRPSARPERAPPRMRLRYQWRTATRSVAP